MRYRVDLERSLQSIPEYSLLHRASLFLADGVFGWIDPVKTCPLHMNTCLYDWAILLMCLPLMPIQLRPKLTVKFGADALMEQWSILGEDRCTNDRFAIFGRWLRTARMSAQGRDRLKWSQKTGRSAKVYPKPLKGYEDGKAPELYRSV
jgi:hypothetical protein